MQVSSQPYRKTYTFPLLSVAALGKLLLIVLSIALPFFVTYSTPNFYLSSHLATSSTPSITPSPKYHIEITTSASSYIYTNLYTYSSSRGIAIEESYDQGVLTLRVRWAHADSTQRVTKVQITTFFSYVASGATQLGMASGTLKGYSIAEGSIAGTVSIEQGTGQGAITENNLTLNGYNLIQTQLQMTQSLNYLSYQYSALPINLPSDVTVVSMVVNYGGVVAWQETPSVLGQVVWSWVQYFPILLTLFWLLDHAYLYLLQQRVLRCRTVHDKEYLTIVEGENARRERLRQV